MTENLVPIEYQNQRILLTEQLAQIYETEANNIKNNYNNHKENFSEGVHFYFLQGDDLKAFREYLRVNDIDLQISPMTRALYLWTERGASRHCKILDTAKAWEQFDNLEATYFRAKEQALLNYRNLSPELQMFKQIFDSVARTELEQKQQAKALADMNQKLDDTCELIALDPNDWRKESQKLLARVAEKLGGIEHVRNLHEDVYKLVDLRGGVSLKRRLDNKKARLTMEGASKTTVRNLNRLDVIGDDKKLIEIYVHIVKQMAAKYQVAPREEE